MTGFGVLPERLARAVVLVLLVGGTLAGCAVEAVTGDIADQQLCVAAQPVLDAVADQGEGDAVPGESDAPPSTDLRELAGRAADGELQSALTGLAEAYADTTGESPDSPEWDAAVTAGETLERVCQRLAAY